MNEIYLGIFGGEKCLGNKNKPQIPYYCFQTLMEGVMFFSLCVLLAVGFHGAIKNVLYSLELGECCVLLTVI